MNIILAACFVGLFVCQGSAQGTNEQLSSARLSERAQRALFLLSTEPFKITANTVTAPALVENPAVRQLQADKTPFPILATLPNGGSSFFITALKPCGLLLPHVHQRATEQYIIISGVMGAGLSEENGGRQNVTFDVSPGQSFLVPQGLVHFNANKGCTPLVFLQAFNHADPGAINIIGALASLKGADNQTLAASNAGSITASPQAAFALDPVCLSRCGLTSTGGDLSKLSSELQALMGLSTSSGASTSTAPSSG